MAGGPDEHHEIHLPAPSAAPIIAAAGASLLATGVIWPSMAFVGALILTIGIGVWAFGPR